MGCCGCCKKGEDEKIPDPPKGFIEERKCTDLFCLIVFAIFWLGMIIIGAVGLASGEPKRLIYGTDYQGNACGVDGRPKLIVYPRTNEDLLMNMQGGQTDFTQLNPFDFKFYGICVDACPKELDVVCNYATEANEAEGTPAFDPASVPTNSGKLDCMNGEDSANCEGIRDNCWINPMNTSSTFFRCIPNYSVFKNADNVTCLYPPDFEGDPLGTFPSLQPGEDPFTVQPTTASGCIVVEIHSSGGVRKPAQPNILFDKLNSVSSLWGRWFGDLQRSWWVVLVCGVVIALVVSFLFLYFLRAFAGCMVWTSIILTVLLSIVLTIFCYFKAGILTPEVAESLLAQGGINVGDNFDEGGRANVEQKLSTSADHQTAFKYGAYVFTALTIILILVIVGVRKSIADTIRIIKKSSDALRSTPMVIFYPLVTVGWLLALLIWWVYVAAALVSAGDKLAVNTTKLMEENAAALPDDSPFKNITTGAAGALTSVTPNQALRYMLAYHFFGLLWTNQVIQGIGMVTIAGVVTKWYFRQKAAADEDEAEETEKMPVFNAFKRAMRYHVGSIAFGGFLIAFLQFLRVVAEYMKQQLEKQGGKDSRMVRMVACVIQCCLGLIQKCVEVITRNAFIYIAMKGMTFCSAAKAVIVTVVSNTVLMATVNAIGEVIMMLCRAFVTCLCAMIAFYLIDNLESFQTGGEDEITSSWLPVLMTMIFAYFTAAGFFYVFDIAMDTILICFITDKKENNGKAMHMDQKELTGGKEVKEEPVKGAGESKADQI